MNRFVCWRMPAPLALAAVMLFGPPAAAQAPKLGGAVVRTEQPPYGGAAYLPGYWVLQMESVRKELELADDQRQKLQQLAEKYTKAQQEDSAALSELYRGVNWGEMTADERTKKLQAIRAKSTQIQEKTKARTEEIRKQIESVLLPRQWERLKQIEFRQRAAGLLYSPKILDELGLSEAQKEQLRKAREEMSEKMQALQRESVEKALGVLTPQQLEKLEQIQPPGAQPAKPQ